MPSTPIHNPLAPPAAGEITATRVTARCKCACRCGIRVHLGDGAVRYIDGNPDHPLNQGVIGAKGSSGIMKQYSPARLAKPLKRKPGANRGGGGFVWLVPAFLTQYAGLLGERWCFFAEANHPQNLYYQAIA